MKTLKKANLLGLAVALVIIIVLVLLAAASYQASVTVAGGQHRLPVNTGQKSHMPSQLPRIAEGSSGGGTGGG